MYVYIYIYIYIYIRVSMLSIVDWLRLVEVRLPHGTEDRNPHLHRYDNLGPRNKK